MDYFDNFYRPNPNEYQQVPLRPDPTKQINEIKSKYKSKLIVAFITLLVINLIVVVVMSVVLNTKITKKVNNIGQLAKEEVVKDLTKEILEAYAKENYLPEDYVSIGMMVAQKMMSSVLEIKCSSSTVRSSASGIIISNDGYVLTNAHVITYEKTQSSIIGQVTGKEVVYPSIMANFAKSSIAYSMTVVHYDVALDLAVIKFVAPPADLKPVIFGNSDLLKMGEETVIIGNAQGLGTSITTGVVSQVDILSGGVDVIQTDAAINPGNSGGPMFNIYSELMGVASFKVITNDANEGLGFAISSNEAKKYINRVNDIKKINIKYKVSEN